jgi:hypothetical protein
MNSHRANIHTLMRTLDEGFAAFDNGQRGRLFDSRDSLVKLSQEVAAGGWMDTAKLCDLTAKLLGRVLREGALDERAALSVVRELHALVEGQVANDPDSKPGQLISDGAGGVFRIVNESRLGDTLVRMGKLHPAQVQQALVLQRVSKDKRFGEVLIAMNAIDQRTLQEALTAQQSKGKEKGGLGTLSSGVRLAPLPELPDGPSAMLPAPPTPGKAGAGSPVDSV